MVLGQIEEVRISSSITENNGHNERVTFRKLPIHSLTANAPGRMKIDQQNLSGHIKDIYLDKIVSRLYNISIIRMEVALMNIGSESEKTEFKQTTGELKDAMNAVCAMLNKHCYGEVYFGVDDKGYVRGQQISDSTRKDVSRVISEAIEPKITPTIEVVNMDEKQVLKVSVSGHSRPYSAYGLYLTRVGTENRKMTTDELRRLIKNDDYASKWERESTVFTSDDIDHLALEDFYHCAVNCGRLEMPTYDKERLLASLELTDNGHLNNAGNALFGTNADIYLKLATFATNDKVTFLDLKLLKGNIYNLANTAISYISNRINWRAKITGRRREDIPEIPMAALREIVINSFAHANYEISTELEISIHPGKIVIYNPGSFPDDLTPYDFGPNRPPCGRSIRIPA